MLYYIQIKKILKLITIIVVILTLTNCEKSADYNEPVFALQCWQSGSDDDYIGINFATTAKTFPHVIINGEEITDWWMYETDIEGGIEIESTSKIEYEIIDGNRKQTGIIEMPDAIDEIECNGTDIDDGESYSSNIEIDSSYDFEWDDEDCDHVIFYCGYMVPTIKNVFLPDVTDYSIDEDDLKEYNQDEFFYVNLSTINGVALTSGAKPNVEGEYGRGFVYAENESSFEIDLYDGYSAYSHNQQKISKQECRKVALQNFREAYYGLIE